MNLVRNIIYASRPRLGDLFTTFDDLPDDIFALNDSHVGRLLRWIHSGHWNGVLPTRWKADQQTGHFSWDDDNATVGGGYESDHSLSSLRNAGSPTPLPPFHTGSANDMFNDQIKDMLQLGKFNLLTQGIADRTRVQYLACWKRWGQYCNCLDIAPGYSPLLEVGANR